MRTIVFILAAIAVAGCGNEIGDSCFLDTDCSTEGDRICLPSSDQPGGYCSIFGCDHDTCPDEAVCVRFFAVGTTNRPCNPEAGASGSGCSPDEFCTIGGSCVPRSAEIRYCMKKCDAGDECRDDYECRTRELMIAHGGEPVPPPDEPLSSDPQGFCAAAPPPP